MDWNVSGVDPALRHRAEEAARHAGASLAVWLSETILSTATISPPSHLPPPLGFKTRPRNGFRRTIRANLAGFLLGVAIIGAALWGFIYVLDEQEAALSPRRGASTYVPPLPATAPDNAAPIPANPQLAALRAAAAEGDPVAQTQLAQRYLDGNGVAADPVMAAQLLEEAAVQGYADGQYRLAMINEEGRGRAKDSAMAFFWYDSAASRGSIPAAARLGILYAEGRGTAKDYMHAATWFRSEEHTSELQSH